MSSADDFEEFYRVSYSRVLAVAYGVCGDMHEAQDIASEAYTRAWGNWSEVSNTQDPTAWTRTVTWRLAVDGWRRRRTARAWNRLNGPQQLAVQLPPSEETVSLMQELAKLPLTQRHCLVLYYIADLKVKDVASMLRIPEGTVKSEISRGRRALSAAFSQSSHPNDT